MLYFFFTRAKLLLPSGELQNDRPCRRYCRGSSMNAVIGATVRHRSDVKYSLYRWKIETFVISMDFDGMGAWRAVSNKESWWIFMEPINLTKMVWDYSNKGKALYFQQHEFFYRSLVEGRFPQVSKQRWRELLSRGAGSSWNNYHGWPDTLLAHLISNLVLFAHYIVGVFRARTSHNRFHEVVIVFLS